MKLTLSGHDKRYLIESLSLLFFPGVGFSETVEDRLEGHSTYCAQTGLAEATILAHENAARGLSSSEEGEPPELAIARSYYHAGVSLTGAQPPWGTLTGVRPAKKVHALLREGKTPEQVAAELERAYLLSPEKTALCVQTLEGEAAALARIDKEAVSLYIHIPFCPSRCSYCSFVSASVEQEGALIPAYVNALEQELALTGRALADHGIRVQNIYVGGGTPTVLSAEQLYRVLHTTLQGMDCSHVAEFTVEAGRPDTLDERKLDVMRACGVNRICVNTQTTDDDTLARVGRQHTAEQFFSAFSLARQCGFDRINVDLIAGLPQESAEVFHRSVREVSELHPENLTIHTLALKRTARLTAEEFRQDLAQAKDIAHMLLGAQQRVLALGYRPYYLYRQRNTLGNLENVGYAFPGTEGLYNICTMGEHQSIVAVGAGGVSKVVGLPNGRIERVWNRLDAREYIALEDQREEKRKELFALLRQWREA